MVEECDRCVLDMNRNMDVSLRAPRFYGLKKDIERNHIFLFLGAGACNKDTPHMHLCICTQLYSHL